MSIAITDRDQSQPHVNRSGYAQMVETTLNRNLNRSFDSRDGSSTLTFAINDPRIVCSCGPKFWLRSPILPNHNFLDYPFSITSACYETRIVSEWFTILVAGESRHILLVCNSSTWGVCALGKLWDDWRSREKSGPCENWLQLQLQPGFSVSFFVEKSQLQLQSNFQTLQHGTTHNIANRTLTRHTWHYKQWLWG